MNKSNVQYKVIPENGVVVATIYNTSFDAVDMINERFMQHATSSLYIKCRDYRDERFMMPNYFKAVAKCHDGDVFDENVGKRIALNKLTDAYHNSLNVHLFNYLTYISACADNIEEYLAKRTKK